MKKMSSRRRLKPLSGVNMTAMIDVFLVLIIFFMVSSTLVKSRGIQVKLPNSKSAEAETKSLIILSIKNDGSMFLGDQPVSLANLGAQLKSRRSESGQDTVIIRGDEQIPYSKMVEAMDAAKMAGMEKISLATDSKR
jgi:biopolymer transport protein ExbD